MEIKPKLFMLNKPKGYLVTRSDQKDLRIIENFCPNGPIGK